MRQESGGGPVSPLTLSIAVARLNSRIRSSGLSSRELYTQRNQFTHEQLPFCDTDIIQHTAERRDSNHVSSALSKSGSKGPHSQSSVSVGDLIYLYADKDKSKARPRYIVVSVADDWCYVKKFVGRQLRSNSYKVKVNECYRVPSELPVVVKPFRSVEYDTEDLNDAAVPSSIEYPDTDNSKEASLPDPPVIEPKFSMPVPIVLSTPLESCCSSSDVREDIESDVVQATSDTPSRPHRDRKMPSYLNDYVMY